MDLLPQNVSNKAVVNSGLAFAISEANGNVLSGTSGGFYSADTRFVSRLRLAVDDKDPEPVGLGFHGYRIASFYSVLRSSSKEGGKTMSIVRDRMVDKGLHDDIYIANHTIEPLRVRLELELWADFADVFEVRRAQLQERRPVTIGERPGVDVALVYEAPKFHRETWFIFSEKPTAIAKTTAHFELEVGSHSFWKTCVDIIPVGETKKTETLKTQRCVSSYLIPPFSTRSKNGGAPGSRLRARRRRGGGSNGMPNGSSTTRRGQGPLDTRLPSLHSDDPEVEEIYSRALDDLRALQIQVIPKRFILAAGIPWFMALFGRDSIIAAIQTKLLGQKLMTDTLQTLSEFQAKSVDDFRESEPGKIPHEIRHGELSVGEKIPHSRYYGTVDATPLFVILLSEAYRWTGNPRIIEQFLPAAEAALAWMEKYGDKDGDGFLEYEQKTPNGLRNQGWKDSNDSISFSDGRLAEPPIALAEVQGYAYAARVGMAELYSVLGRNDEAKELTNEAALLKDRFNREFWMEQEGYFCIALDKDKRQVDSIASNAGQCLWSGIVEGEKRSSSLVRRLLDDDMFSGWGIRTLSTEMARYEPLSYHNGSVWPHDNSIIAAGMARYGYVQEASKVVMSIMDAAAASPNRRLPELFAGYSRRELDSPIPYPGANAPQAWASGAVVYSIETLLGVTPRENHLFLEARVSGPSISLRGIPFRGSRRYL